MWRTWVVPRVPRWHNLGGSRHRTYYLTVLRAKVPDELAGTRTLCGDTRDIHDLTCPVSVHCSVSLWPHFLSLYHLLSLFSVTWPLPLTPVLWSYKGPRDHPECTWIIPDHFSILQYITAVTSLLLYKVTQPQVRMLFVFRPPTVYCRLLPTPILIVCNTHVFVHSIVWVPGSLQASECGTKAFPPAVHSINSINRTETQPALDSLPAPPSPLPHR